MSSNLPAFLLKRVSFGRKIDSGNKENVYTYQFLPFTLSTWINIKCKWSFPSLFCPLYPTSFLVKPNSFHALGFSAHWIFVLVLGINWTLQAINGELVDRQRNLMQHTFISRAKDYIVLLYLPSIYNFDLNLPKQQNLKQIYNTWQCKVHPHFTSFSIYLKPSPSIRSIFRNNATRGRWDSPKLSITTDINKYLPKLRVILLHVKKERVASLDLPLSIKCIHIHEDQTEKTVQGTE